jgi:DNA-binding NarL/FixJ family response regulator
MIGGVNGMAETPTPTRIVIVDDHVMVAEGVRRLINSKIDLRTVGIASSAAEGVRLAVETEADVVLMDFYLPDGDGITATAEILQQRPETLVIMFSSEENEVLLARAVEAGCVGFIRKTQSSTEILSMIRAVSRGESIVSTAMLSALLNHLTSPRVPPAHGLTTRELEVLGLLARGVTTESISTSLFLSTHTVRNHIRNILAKLGAHSKLAAVAIATREGIVSLDDRRVT